MMGEGCQKIISNQTNVDDYNELVVDHELWNDFEQFFPREIIKLILIFIQVKPRYKLIYYLKGGIYHDDAHIYLGFKFDNVDEILIRDANDDIDDADSRWSDESYSYDYHYYSVTESSDIVLRMEREYYEEYRILQETLLNEDQFEHSNEDLYEEYYIRKQQWKPKYNPNHGKRLINRRPLNHLKYGQCLDADFVLDRPLKRRL